MEGVVQGSQKVGDGGQLRGKGLEGIVTAGEGVQGAIEEGGGEAVGGEVCGGLGGEQPGLLGDKLGPLLWRGFLVLQGLRRGSQ